MTRMRIATGIDIPMAPSCGSMILCGDVYGLLREQAHTTFFSLPPADESWDHGYESVRLLTTPKRPYGDYFADYADKLTTELEPYLRDVRPDLIHAQHLGFGLSLAFSRLRGDIPMISFGHGTDVIAAQGSDQALDAMRQIVAASLAVIVPAESMREKVDRLTDRRYTSRLRVIPWGIALAGAKANYEAGPRGPLSLLQAGRLDTNKSTITAIESLALTSERHRLTIAGGGDTLPALRETTNELGLADRVTFLPFLPQRELWAMFADFDAFVFTTRELEAFGLVCVEAQAHGLPIIFSSVEGAVDVLGTSGLSFPPGDPVALARCIDQFAADLDLRRALSARAVKNAERYSVANTAAAILKVSELGMRGTHG
jgi:glycosyltransferase involved in cell wall biosynthesis